MRRAAVAAGSAAPCQRARITGCDVLRHLDACVLRYVAQRDESDGGGVLCRARPCGTARACAWAGLARGVCMAQWRSSEDRTPYRGIDHGPVSSSRAYRWFIHLHPPGVLRLRARYAYIVSRNEYDNARVGQVRHCCDMQSASSVLGSTAQAQSARSDGATVRRARSSRELRSRVARCAAVRLIKPDHEPTVVPAMVGAEPPSAVHDPALPFRFRRSGAEPRRRTVRGSTPASGAAARDSGPPSPQSSMQRHPWCHCRRAAWALRPWAWPPSDGPTADGAGCWLLHDMPCNSC